MKLVSIIITTIKIVTTIILIASKTQNRHITRGTIVKRTKILLVNIAEYIVFVCTVGPIYYGPP